MQTQEGKIFAVDQTESIGLRKGVRNQKPNGPKGAADYSVPDPFSKPGNSVHK
jgi:hypothetical protein